MADTIQINTDLRILSYVSPWWTECYAQHLQNITLTGSLSFRLLRRSRKPTHSVPALLSYVLSIPWFLLSEVSPGQFLLGSWGGSKEDPRLRSAGEVKDLEGLGLHSLCVNTIRNTHAPQPTQSPWGEICPQPNQSNLHEVNLTQKMLFSLDFPLFLPFFFHYTIKKRKAYRFGEMLWIVSSRWSEWWQQGIEHPRWLQRSNAWMVPHLCKEHVM